MTDVATARVRIRGVAHGGAGVGREVDPANDTRTWFVRGALPGELVEAVCDRQARRSLHGHTHAVVEPSEDRVEPPCPIADRCGGCEWQHVAPAAQAGYKGRIVADQLRAILKRTEIELPAPVAGPSALGYRRRARMHYRKSPDGIVLGFRRSGTHELVDVPRCPVLDPALDVALQRIRGLAAKLPESGNALGVSDGQRVVLGLPGARPSADVVAAFRDVLDDVLVGVTIRGGRQRATVGRETVELDGRGGLAAVPCGPFSFCQAQAAVNSALVAHVVETARCTGQRVLELHAGSGNFTRALARIARRVWVVEQSRESVAVLRALAEGHGLSINAKHGEAERVVARLAAQGRGYDVVVLDPPRSGLGQAASRDLAKVATSRVVYVSCDAATLARDLEVLADQGFVLEDLRVFDMMPMTPESEIVATMAALTRGPA